MTDAVGWEGLVEHVDEGAFGVGEAVGDEADCVVWSDACVADHALDGSCVGRVGSLGAGEACPDPSLSDVAGGREPGSHVSLGL